MRAHGSRADSPRVGNAGPDFVDPDVGETFPEERQDPVKRGFAARPARVASVTMVFLATLVVAAVALGVLVAPWVFLIAAAAALMWLTLAFARVV